MDITTTTLKIGPKVAIYDTEANGLHEATKIWCVSVMDYSTKEITSFGPDSIDAALDYLSQFDTLIAHNQLDYDRYIINNITGIDLASHSSLLDTLVLSRLLHPDRPLPVGISQGSGAHSIEAWGLRFGHPKPKHEDWTQYSPEMLHRCEEDVRINCKVFEALLNEMGDHDWGKAIELEHRVQEIISAQARRGVYFDLKAAEELIQELTEGVDKLTKELEENAPVKWKSFGVDILEPFKKDGTLKKMVTDWLDDQVNGPFTRVYSEKINLDSDVQLKDYLFKLGWKPTQYNFNKETGERTSPKLEFEDGDGLDSGIGKKIKDRKLFSHRLNQVRGLVERVRQDNRIEADANTIGTNTRRFRHRNVVNIPRVGTPYGERMRALFTCTPGKVLVGYDAKGLELRMLAHYMNDEEYTNVLLNGDIHTFNQELAGLATRDDAKTFIYAFNYGAGDAKLGSIVGGGTREGRELRTRFLQSNQALDKLIRSVKRRAGRGYLESLDGGKLFIRIGSDGKRQLNKALNTLLQGNGAVVMKQSMVFLDDMVKAENLDAWKVIDMHDEAQWDVHPDHVERFSELCQEAMVKTGIHFNLNLPLEADVKIGKNWAETH